MKKALLGTTALVGAALLTVPAAAQLEVTVGGDLLFLGAGYVDDISEDVDLAPGVSFDRTNREFETDTEIVIEADGVADNGLLYGAEIQLEADQDTEDNADEVFIYLEGNWGRVELGDNDGAADSTQIFAPTVGLGQIDGEFSDFISLVEPQPKLDDTSDDTKVTYYTPRFAGFQLGVSYVPEDDEGNNVIFERQSSENFIEVGGNYLNEFGGIGVAISGAYIRGSANDTLDEADDTNQFQGGAQIAWGGFTIGGAYLELDNAIDPTSDSDDANAWNAGISYEQGPWGVAFSYNSFDSDGQIGAGNSGLADAVNGAFDADGDGETDDDTLPIVHDDSDFFSVGVVYTVAPGLTAAADFAYFQNDFENTGVDPAFDDFEDEGFIGVFGIEASF